MVCLLCGGACRRANLCDACLRDLPANRRACKLCALPREGLADGVCGPCLQHPPPWCDVRAPLRYEFPVDVLVHMLKYRRKLAAGPALAWAMTQQFHSPSPQLFTALVPVPLHWTRLAWRGFNQATELTRELSRCFGLPVIDRLIRTRRTPAQAGLNASRRRRNLRGAFRWRGPSLGGRRVLLVDDVMTTGSTAAACTRALLRAGAGEVVLWVVARSVGQQGPALMVPPTSVDLQVTR